MKNNGHPVGWELVPLGELRGPSGETLDSRRFASEEFTLYSVPSHESRVPERVLGGSVGSAKRAVQEGTVLVCRINPRINRVWVVSPDSRRMLASTEWIQIPATNGINPRFLAYQLEQEDFREYLASNVSGVGGSLMRVRESVADRFAVAVAPENEQARIVELLESLLSEFEKATNLIQAQQRMLKAYRAAVLKAACEGRLVPTEAELARAEGRDYEPAEDLVRRLSRERENARAALGAKRDLVDSMMISMPHDSLPQGWAWVPWVNLAGRVTVGYVGPLSDEHAESGVPLIRSQNVRENRFVAEGMSRVSEKFHDANKKSAARGGDLCVVRSGNVGITCALPEELGEVNCSDIVIIQRPVGVVSKYGAYVMNSVARGRIAGGKVGIGLTHYNTKSVASIPVPLPPLPEQHRIVAEVERRLSVVEQLEAAIARSLQRAARLRQAILKQAFEGKLVPQDPSDEPASVLLARIRKEREGRLEERAAGGARMLGGGRRRLQREP